MASPLAEYRYDLFFVCARSDISFVQGNLVPALGVASERILLLGDFTPGAAITAEIERGVAQSRFTIVVLSPAFLGDRWSLFGEQLASYSNTMKGRLLPLLLKPCEVPTRLEFLVALDFTDPRNWPGEAARLRRHVFPGNPELQPVVSAPTRVAAPEPDIDGRDPKASSADAHAGPRRAVVVSGGRHRPELSRIVLVVASIAIVVSGGIAWMHRQPPPPDGRDAARTSDAGSGASGDQIVAGSVVDAQTNRGVGQTLIEIARDSASEIERGLSDDVGNFRIATRPAKDPQQRLLLRVSKTGYKQIQRWILPPVEDLVLPLIKD